MKHAKAYRIFMTIIGAIIIGMGLLLLIVSPIAGIVAILGGVFSIIFGRKIVGQQSPKTKNNDVRESYEKIYHGRKKQDESLDNTFNTLDEIERINEKTERHHVAGTSFRQKEIESLGHENEDYGWNKRELIEYGMENEYIYQLTFEPKKVELIEEPDNAEFPHAIKVLIDDILVGYIKKGSANHVRNLLHNGRIRKVSAKIEGGKYKYLECKYDNIKNKDIYNFIRNEKNFFITIEIIVENSPI